MITFLSNIRYALRIFSRRKVFSAVVVLTVAIGIGTSTAMFSVVNSILRELLPVADPDKLVIIGSVRSGEKGRISRREIQDIKEGTKGFTDVALSWYIMP